MNKVKNTLNRVSSYAYRKCATLRRRIVNREKYKSIDFFIDNLRISQVELNSKGKKIHDKPITEICTLDSVYTSFYFPKGCACLVSDIVTARKAIEHGALLLITSEDYAEFPCMICDDPLGAYADMCLYFRDLKKDMPITAICGSIGKTTIKNMVGEVYKMKYITSYTQSNVNTRMAVGFSVQHIPDKAEIMIQEIHEGTPNITQYVSRMLHPAVFIITPIDLSHFQNFGSKQKIEEEICSVTKYMSDGSNVIVNVDDFSRFDLLDRMKITTISTLSEDADFYSKNVVVGNEGLSFSIVERNTQIACEVRLTNIFAPHNVICALYAFAAGVISGIEPKDIVKGLGNYHTSGVRQNVFRTKDNVLIYADCYNAIGKSMKSAIEAADAIPNMGRKIAVLGDVAEVGSESGEMHKAIIEQVNSSSFDCLFTIGDELKKALDKVDTRDSLLVKSANSLSEMNTFIKDVVKPDDLVLFKASHSSNLSQCIKDIWPKEYIIFIKPAYDEYSSWVKNSMWF